jgi:hypothetical protein
MSAGRKNTGTNKHYNTPPKYVALIEEFFGTIDLDPCSNKYSLINAGTKFILPTDGLKECWTGYKTTFINCPYGRDSENKTSIYHWVEKAYLTWLTALDPKPEFLFLIPVASNTRHFKNLIFKEFSGICFLNDTRLKFYSEGKELIKGAPCSCCFCYLGPNYDKFEKIFKNSGKCFKIN